MKQKTKKDYTIIENNTDIIKKYSDWLTNKDYSDETIHNKLVVLHPFFRFLNFKKAKEITKDDIESYFASLRKVKNVNTINRYKIELRFFFNWLKPKNKFFSDITTKKEFNDLKVEDLITEEEAHKIIQNTRNTRDRALLHVMYDSASRLSELRNMKKKDVFIDQYGAKIRVNGKTGERIIRIIDSVPDLQIWMNQHTGTLDDYLFPVLPEMTQFSKHGIRNILKAACKRAGIKEEDKNIYPHLFRHSKLTDMFIKGMTETQLKPFAGWTKTSQMAAIYIHLGESDIDDKVLEIAGIKKEEVKEKKTNNLKVCPFCKTKNPFDGVYCINCSRIIDQTRANTVNPEREEIKKLSDDIENYKKEMEIKSEIDKNKHSIQILKMQKKLEPEHADEIQKMIEGLQNVIDHLHNKLYKVYEKYREDVEEPELLNES